MNLVIQTTSTLSVHKNLENIRNHSDRIIYNHAVQKNYSQTILCMYSMCVCQWVSPYSLTSALSLTLFFELRIPPLLMVVSYNV